MTQEQIAYLSALATILTFGLRIAATYANIHIGRFLATLLLWIVASALAVQWSGVQLPPFGGDIGAWLAALVALAGPLVALATLIYNALYAQVVVPLTAKFAKAKK